YVDIRKWTLENEEDPAVKDFMLKLKHHLLGTILDRRDEKFSDDECARLKIVNNRLYRHKTLDIKYTSYDILRCHDSINIATRADIIVLADEDHSDAHLYWYTQVIGIFHVAVKYRNHTFNVPFLWVRWVGLDTKYVLGPAAKRLPCVGFMGGPDAFGFLDPEYVLFAAHLIPAFAYSHHEDLLGPSIACQPREEDSDWDLFYVNIFVDRDMFTHYIHGIAVGHYHIHVAKRQECQDSSSDNDEPRFSSNNAPAALPDSEDDEEMSDVENDEGMEKGGEERDAQQSELDDYGYHSGEDGENDEDEVEEEGNVDEDEDESQWVDVEDDEVGFNNGLGGSTK
ncbi:hypothetical protein V5O48_018991, partial [Marasmius crinis-equi]